MELLIKLKQASNADNIIRYLKKQDAVKSVALRNDFHRSTKIIIPNKELHQVMFKTSLKALENFFANEPEEKLF